MDGMGKSSIGGILWKMCLNRLGRVYYRSLHQFFLRHPGGLYLEFFGIKNE